MIKKILVVKLGVCLLGWLLIMSSCKKERAAASLPKTGTDKVSSVTPAPNNEPLITGLEYSPNLYTLFKYNGAGQPISISDVNPPVRTDYTITYQSNGKVDKIISGNGFWKFTYNNNLLTQADSYTNNSSSPQGYYKFVYDGQKVIQVLIYNKYSDVNVIQLYSKTEFQYDVNGDITGSVLYVWDIATGKYYKGWSQIFESDNHPNPLYRMRDIFIVLYHVVGPHNFTKDESFYEDGTLNQNNVYEFKYSSQGYPVSAGRKNLAVSPNTFVTLNFNYQ